METDVPCVCENMAYNLLWKVGADAAGSINRLLLYVFVWFL